MPVPEDQKAQDDARELRSAAVRLRDLIPQFREAPGTEFVPWSVANLLEAIAECVANGQRLRYKGVRFVDQKLTRTASSTTTLAQITGGPGSIVYHSYVGGVGATNLSWMERNFSITVDGEATPQIVATGTEDWFDSGWYFQGRRDYNTSFHSYVGTNQPAGNVNTVGMATDLWSKWGGVPFTTSAVVRSLPEAGCTTGDTLCWCILYYQ
jgi:hypothetical protein